jgi:F420-dependent oxidoreductase-like protein
MRGYDGPSGLGTPDGSGAFQSLRELAARTFPTEAPVQPGAFGLHAYEREVSMRICLMIEGQEDVTWEQWLALAATCEAHGIEALFRSDHYGSVAGRRERGSLDAWATLAGLAARTSSVRLGALVSPATFRHPSVLAKMAATVDHISGGRVEVGIGAGWHELEHTAYGFEMPPPGERVERLAEQLEIVNLEWADGAFSFEGRYFQLRDLDARPKPVQRPRPNLIVGGAAGPRSATLAARWADEYNTTLATVEQCRQRRQRVVAAFQAAGRDPDTVRFSVMTGCVVGRDRPEALERLGRLLDRTGRGGTPEALLDSAPEHVIYGTVEQVVEKLRAYEAAGVQRVMLQHLVHDDLDMVALIGDALVPAMA